MRILIVSSPVAPLSQGTTGGVSLHILSTVQALLDNGNEPDILAPQGSRLARGHLIECVGTVQPSLARTNNAAYYPILKEGVLAAMWRYAQDHQGEYDLILNMAHDWLPYYLTAFFTTPLLHIVNMGNVEPVTGQEIAAAQRQFPNRIAFLSESQARQFETNDAPFILSLGLNLEPYHLNEKPEGGLVWAGRISPEKGLEDALAVAKQRGESLTIAGAVDKADYWADLTRRFPKTIDYRGFLSRDALQQVLGEGRAMLQTQKWDEAFGMITLEAMACGTPVLAYARGANCELIVDGVTGLLVPPDDLGALDQALDCVCSLDRTASRAHVEAHYSMSTFSTRLDAWCKRSTP